MTASAAPPVRPPALRLAAGIAAAWAVVALLLSLQGYLTSGGRQSWWASLGYSLAIFSVWAALTGPVLWIVRRIEAAALSLAVRAGLYATGAVVTAALHVGLFVLVWWGAYSDGGRLSPWAMGQTMFVRNLGTDVILYAGILAVGLWRVRWERRPVTPDVKLDALRSRSRGAVRFVPLGDVTWIGAAGNYAEAHTSSGPVLVDESLASLAGRLPPERFARIHRGAIVRLDRIGEVRSLGRGDAEVVLVDGPALRLSRRYRAALSPWLNGA